MPEFAYRVFNEKGQIHFGKLTAANYPEANKKLKDQNLVVVSLVQNTATFFNLHALQRLSTEQELFFYIQFSSMLATDVPILRALEIITPQIKHQRFKEALQECIRDIRRGASFSESIQKHEMFFSNLVLGMIEAGEESGQLDVIFKQLANYSEEKNHFRNELIAALSYPFLLLMTAIMVSSIIIIFVYPLFLDIFESNEIPLPFATLLFAKASIFLKSYWLILSGSLVLCIAGLVKFAKTPEGSAVKDRFIQKIPLLGEIISQFYLHQLFFNLSILLHNGVPLLKCIELLAKTLSNITMTQLLADIWVTLRQGGAMSDAIQKHEELPVLVHQMTIVGEQTGNLEPIMEELARYYSTIGSRRLKRLTIIIEPALLFLMGAFVTLLLASLMLPMFRMVRTLR